MAGVVTPTLRATSENDMSCSSTNLHAIRNLTLETAFLLPRNSMFAISQLLTYI